MVKMRLHRASTAGCTLRSILGFQVCSPHPLRFLRTGGGNGILDIRIQVSSPAPPLTRPLLEWKLQGSANVSAELHGDVNGYRFWISDVGWYLIDPANRIIHIPEGGDEIFREHRLWGVPTLLCAMHRGDFFLHAAGAEVDGDAVLFAAPGRHGKTTLAMGFHEAGYRVLSEDSACCRLTSAPVLVPGPALLRVRPDVFNGRPPSGTHVAAAYDDRIYLALDEGRSGSDDPVRIRALLFLRDSANEIYFERVPAQKALPDLWALSFRLPNDADRSRCFKQLVTLAGSIPIWNLYRPLRLASLSGTVARVAEMMRRSRECLSVDATSSDVE